MREHRLGASEAREMQPEREKDGMDQAQRIGRISRAARALATYLALTATLAVGVRATLCRAETLQEILGSRELKGVREQTEVARRRNRTSAQDDRAFSVGIDPNTEYARLWLSTKGPELLLTWIGATIPGYKILPGIPIRHPEQIAMSATLSTRDRVRVYLDVLIPHPTYHMMVKYKTMRKFNEFEPPTLEVVASEELTINGRAAMYYRTPKGACSLLFKIAQLGIVNLRVAQCENSAVMTDIAEKLDFARLDGKLDS